MNAVEEKLWNFLDGTCSPEEQEKISRLIASDEVYRKKYEELLAFNTELQDMELDMPPMAFTYNVMETIRAEEAQKPLKAAIDQRIIRGLAVFFILTIVVVLGIVLSSVNWSAEGGHSSNILSNMQVPNVKNLFNGSVIKAFLFFDVVLGLYLFDSYLRKREVA